MWFNVTGEESTRRGEPRRPREGREIQRRRTYNDRIINTFDDGFVVQYTLQRRAPRRLQASRCRRAWSPRCTTARS